MTVGKTTDIIKI